MWTYRRRAAQLDADAPAGTWTAACIEPGASRTVKGLIIGDAGVQLVSLWNGSTLGQWTWPEINGQASRLDTFSIGLREARGLRIELRNEPALEFAFPSNGFLRYPSDTAQTALDQIRRHAGHEEGR